MKVGEYVRTKKGNIGILKNISGLENELCYINLREHRQICVEISDITKHSKIISEIVEVGDLVNGKLIHKIDKGTNYCYLYYGNCKTFVDYQIKKILTKEQMEANQYVVEGDDIDE